MHLCWDGAQHSRDYDRRLVATRRSIVTHQSPGLKHTSISWMEAAYLALLALFKSCTPPPQHVLLQMDNSTAVAYVNKKGGTRSTLCRFRPRTCGRWSCRFLGYSEAHSADLQRGGRHGISTIQQSLRIGTSQRYLSED